MPLYDYQCKHCQLVFEVHATFKEKEAGLEPECPQCHSKRTRQLLTSGLLLLHNAEGPAMEFPACGPNAGAGCCGG
ncbi:MAG TPA: zinc ribbon domain-containing protein [Anaerolineales bacterium]|nr:zinc ribbon domain-containing protein [Anaerolineales bacterium]